MVRVVLDTNVFVSILLKSKSCLKIRNAFLDGAFDIVTSPDLIKELIATIGKPKFKNIFDHHEIKNLIELINIDAILSIPEEKITVCRDPADNIILECAVSGKVDFIVTGDKDLLTLKSFRKISIITPKKFLEIIS